MYSVSLYFLILVCNFFFFFNDTATTEIYTLSLHDALPIALGVGAATLSRVIAETAGQPGHVLGATYRKHGDLGGMAEELLRSTNRDGDLSLADVARLFDDLAAARGQTHKAELLANAFERSSDADVKYIVKITTGDLRIGSKESLVEEAIAKAFERPLAEVRRANMLTGDIGETLTLAAQNRSEERRVGKECRSR